jgi:RHS repeat-associated protein
MTGTLSPGDVSNSPAGGYNISHAGYDVGVTQLNIPYATRRAAMIDSAEANYAYFDLPNALEGQSRQTREFVLPAEDSEEMGNGGSVGCSTGPRGEVSYNGNIWFIHTDHLGSSTLVTDGNGDISQQIEYLPYGEVFMEKQSTTYATPYKFNGKELDEETGLYYYGARYMNPRLSIWYGCDPLQEKYPDVSTYTYCAGNPILATDPTGEEWIISSSVDKNGGVSVNIKITGVVYNNSTEDIDMYAFRKAVVSQIEDVFTFSDDVERFEVKTKADIRVVNSVDDISEKDHVFQIVNQSSLDLGTLAETNGLNIIVGSTTAKETIAGTNTRTISHELGHSGGLEDTNKSNVDKVKLKTNLMTQISALQSLRVPNPKHVVGLTPTQIRRIIQNKESSNQKSAIRYQNTYMQSGHLHPMFGFPFLNKTRRKVLK